MGRKRRDESLAAPLREEKGGGEATPNPFGEEKGELSAPFWGENPHFAGGKGGLRAPTQVLSVKRRRSRGPHSGGKKRATKSPRFGERVRETSVPILGGEGGS